MDKGSRRCWLLHRGPTLIAVTLGVAILAQGCVASPQGRTGWDQQTDTSQATQDDYSIWRQHRDSLAEDLPSAPEVATVREVTPETQRVAVSKCMQDRGFAQSPDGSYEVEVAQREVFAEAEYICFASFPVPNDYLDGYTEDQWSMIYDHLVGPFAECVEHHGFEFPSPPSREVFLSGPRSWSPQTDLYPLVVGAVSDGRFESPELFFEEVCPMTPPESVLYSGSGSETSAPS